ncbi:unannotated protein [freshwater metagenome]|uniref:Unannotated protein n=1 Tax=freshwater metagenome TaxID=449393 RepID=A0A6J6M514_9ZZZZ|nr:hypothetical protein [Actinomycetota bacterium]
MVNLNTSKSGINVITGIANPERESFVARTLFESGKNIISRAISGEELMAALKNRVLDGARWIVIFAKDLPGINAIELGKWNDSETSIIELGVGGVPLDLNSLNELIARSLRNPLLHSNSAAPFNTSPRYRSLVGVIGSAGAPGRTSIAMNLAAESSQKHETAIVDADNVAPAMALLLGQSDEKLRNEFKVSAKLSLYTDLSATNEKFQALIDLNSKIYVDLGVMPKISDAIIDRRKSAQEFAHWFEKLSAIIYVANSEEYSIRALERFIDNRADLPKNIKDFYILNKSGTSRRHKAIERRFFDLVPLDLGMVIPYDYSSFDRAQTNCSPIHGVAPRSAIRKSFVELLARIENLEA